MYNYSFTHHMFGNQENKNHKYNFLSDMIPFYKMYKRQNFQHRFGNSHCKEGIRHFYMSSINKIHSSRIRYHLVLDNLKNDCKMYNFLVLGHRFNNCYHMGHTYLCCRYKDNQMNRMYNIINYHKFSSQLGNFHIIKQFDLKTDLLSILCNSYSICNIFSFVNNYLNRFIHIDLLILVNFLNIIRNIQQFVFFGKKYNQKCYIRLSSIQHLYIFHYHYTNLYILGYHKRYQYQDK